MTRFLMSCTECQKRMHFNSNGLEPKGRGEGRRAAGLGRLCRRRPSTSRACPLLAQAEKCTASSCHSSQKPVWVRAQRTLMLVFRFFVGFFFSLKKYQVLFNNQWYIPTSF